MPGHSYKGKRDEPYTAPLWAAPEITNVAPSFYEITWYSGVPPFFQIWGETGGGPYVLDSQQDFNNNPFNEMNGPYDNIYIFGCDFEGNQLTQNSNIVSG